MSPMRKISGMQFTLRVGVSKGETKACSMERKQEDDIRGERLQMHSLQSRL